MSPFVLTSLLVLIAFGGAFFLSERIASRWTLSRRQRREQASKHADELWDRQPEERQDNP